MASDNSIFPYKCTDLTSMYCVYWLLLSNIIRACVINPRRACAARVTVVVCVSVCLSATILALQATRRLMSDASSFSATRAGKIMWRFC